MDYSRYQTLAITRRGDKGAVLDIQMRAKNGKLELFAEDRGRRDALPRHRGALADLHAQAFHALHGRETDLVGDVVADENRGATRKGRLGHEGLDRRPLARAARLRFDDHLAAQQGQARRFLNGGLHGGDAFGFTLGRLAVMQGDRAALGFDAQPRIASHECECAGFHLLERVGTQERDGAIGAAPFGAVHARRGQGQRFQERVDLRDGPPGDQRERAAEVAMQLLERGGQRGRNDHRLRLGRDVHQGAVEVQEYRARGEQDVLEIHGHRP